jgi:hypothetical protein
LESPSTGVNSVRIGVEPVSKKVSNTDSLSDMNSSSSDVNSARIYFESVSKKV